MRRDRERLLDVQDSITRIEEYASRGREAFEQDNLIQTWMLHHLQIIGEACRAISPHFRARHPGVPWTKIIGLRSILVHHYFEIDVDIVWLAVERDIPESKEKVKVILQETE